MITAITLNIGKQGCAAVTKHRVPNFSQYGLEVWRYCTCGIKSKVRAYILFHGGLMYIKVHGTQTSPRTIKSLPKYKNRLLNSHSFIESKGFPNEYIPAKFRI